MKKNKKYLKLKKNYFKYILKIPKLMLAKLNRAGWIENY